MKPSRELRDVVLGIYHDWSVSGMSGMPVDRFSLSEDLTAILIGGIVARGRQLRTILEAQSQVMSAMKITPGPVHAFEEGSVGWAADTPTVGRRVFNFTFVFHREDGAWKIVSLQTSPQTDLQEFIGSDIAVAIASRIAELANSVERDRPALDSVASPDGTVTIMFTDIESSTAVNEALGDDRWITLLRRHTAVLRDHAASFRGEIVKSQGDGFMLAFPSARRGVECAIAVQRALGEDDSSETPVRVRMGLHTGEPVRDADDFFGRDVAYAARIGSTARGGEILVSSLVKSLVEPSGAFTFEGPRELNLRGFVGPQSVFAVIWH